MDDNSVVNEKERRKLTGLSRSTWHRMDKRGEVPACLHLSPGRIGWLKSELLAWREKRKRGLQEDDDE